MQTCSKINKYLELNRHLRKTNRFAETAYNQVPYATMLQHIKMLFTCKPQKILASTFIANLILFCTVVFSAISVYADPKDHANQFKIDLERAENYKAPSDEPQRIQEKINLYVEIIAKYPGRDQQEEAKFELFKLLIWSDMEGSTRHAIKLINELINNIDLKSSLSREIAIENAEFYTLYITEKDIDNLTRAESILEKLINIVESEGDKYTELHAKNQLGRLLLKKENPRKGLRLLLDTLEEARSWVKDGFWIKLYEKDRRLYGDYGTVLGQIRGSVATILDMSDDPALLGILNEYPGQYGERFIKEAKERFQKRITEPQPFFWLRRGHRE